MLNTLWNKYHDWVEDFHEKRYELGTSDTTVWEWQSNIKKPPWYIVSLSVNFTQMGFGIAGESEKGYKKFRSGWPNWWQVHMDLGPVCLSVTREWEFRK